MKRIILSACLVMLSFAFADDGAFRQLHMLKGSWRMKTKNGSVAEDWKLVNTNHLQSKAYSTKAKDTAVYENVALENKADGIFYTVTSTNQNDQKPIAFKLTSAANSKFVFENPKHDFPKRIVYELINKDSLHAFVDDGKDASNKRSHFYYSRVKG